MARSGERRTAARGLIASKQARLAAVKSVLVSSGIAKRAKYATARENLHPQKKASPERGERHFPSPVTFPVIFHARMRILNRSIIPDEKRNYS